MIVLLLACLGVALGAIVGFATASARNRARLDKALDDLDNCRDHAEHLRRRLTMRIAADAPPPYDRERDHA